MNDPQLISESELGQLRRISNAAARAVSQRPARGRFIHHPPDVASLADVDPGDATEARRALREMRQAVLIHTAFGELQGRSALWAGALWAQFADRAVFLADAVAFREVVARLGTPLKSDGSPVGRAVFALGKLGSRELNPSSDIDLLFVYETDDGAAGERALHDFFVRWVRRVRELLSEVDEDGFAFRVDLDLRPEGRGGPLANSVDALESYYETFGLSWERIALLRMRAVVSEGGVAAAVSRRLRAFVFPRSPNPKVVQEMAEMRARIDATAPDTGFDVKRSVGGIRDVEFLVQVLQHLHGRRYPELREGTVADAVRALEARGILPHQDAAGLEAAYLFLRRVEHALQYQEDRQTQLLVEGEGRAPIASVVCPGPDALDAFDRALEGHRRFARERFEELFGEAVQQSLARAQLALDRTATDDERCAALTSMGFSDPPRALEYLAQLSRRRASPFSPRELSRRPGAVRFAARLLDECSRSPAPMTALSRLPDFFSGYMPRRLMERLEDAPRFSNLLLRVLAVSTPLSRLVTHHAGVLDALVDEGPLPRWSAAQLEAALVEEGAREGDDDERAVIAMRRFHARHVLVVALAFLDRRLDVVQAGHLLTALADAVLQRSLALATHMMARRFGRPADGRLAALGLGRHGSREMGFRSDLDLLFVYDGDGETDGLRPVGVAEWASRVAQKTIWIMTAPMTAGPCYEVDTRLRPSGNQGPLCTSLAGFRRYHAGESQLWERQSLLRIRAAAGHRGLGAEVVAAAREASFRGAEPGLGAALLSMRERMVSERVRRGEGFDLKLGEGGIADVEFAVQGSLLAHGPVDGGLWCGSTRRALRRLHRRGYLSDEEARVFGRALDELGALREMLLLLDETQGGATAPDDHRLALIARLGATAAEHATAAALYHRIRALTDEVKVHARVVLERLG